MTIWELKGTISVPFPAGVKTIVCNQSKLGAENTAPTTSQYLFLRKDQRVTVNWSHFIPCALRGPDATFTIPEDRTTHYKLLLLSSVASPGLLKGSNSKCTKLWPVSEADEESSSWSFEMVKSFIFQKWNLSPRVRASQIPTQGWGSGQQECFPGSASSMEKKKK